MHGAPLPDPDPVEKLDDALRDLLDEANTDPEDGLEQVVRDVVLDSEYRDGFRFYAVSPENMRRLASLVDLDQILEH